VAAFAVGLIVAFHPVLVTLSREARSYTLSHLFLAMAAAASVPVLLDRSREPGSPARLAWVAVPAALGVSCHLFSGFFMVGLFAALLLQLRADRGRVVRVLACGALFAVLLSAQLPLTLKQVGQHYSIAPPAAVLTLRDWAHYTLEIAGGKPGGIGVGVLLVLGAAALWRDPVGRFAAVIVLASAVVMLGLHFFVKPILIGGPRYLAWLALPAAVGAAAAAASLRRFGGIALIFVVTGLVVSRSRALDHEETYHEDWRAVAELLREAASSEDLVLCHSAFVADPLELYYGGSITRATFVDREDRLPDLAPASAALLRGDRVFLVWSHAGELSDVVRERLATELGPSEEELTQHAISVLRFGEPR